MIWLIYYHKLPVPTIVTQINVPESETEDISTELNWYFKWLFFTVSKFSPTATDDNTMHVL